MNLDAEQYTMDEARRLLEWWTDAGVDTPVAEEPRHWLKPARAQVAGTEAPIAREIAPLSPAELPADYETFRAYLEQATGLPLDRDGARRVLPHGLPGAKIMLVSEMPAREDAADGQPIGGEAWQLAVRMLAAIGMAPDDAYSASLACFHVPGGKISEAEMVRCGDMARQHVALVKPKRVLLLGEAPARAMLGEPLARARGHAHKIEGVRTMATFHPRWLLQRPGDKALAWRDLLLLMDEV
jgi:uracil-DNA glycosylase family 4